MFASLGSVLLLTGDRFVFITRPLRYNSIMNLNRALLLCLASTVVAAVGAVWYSLSVLLPWDQVKNILQQIRLVLKILPYQSPIDYEG